MHAFQLSNENRSSYTLNCMQMLRCAVTDRLIRKCITFENSWIITAIFSLFTQSITNRVQISYKLSCTYFDRRISVADYSYM